MFEVVMHAVSAVLVLVFVAGMGYWASYRGWFDSKSKQLVSKLVNLALPFFLFYSVTGKFTHDQLVELLKMAYLPFVTVGINFLLSLFVIRIGLVRKEVQGVFIACCTGATVLFVGVPVAMSMYGEVAIPYLLVYFVANCLFIWTIGLYNVQLDGVRRHGGQKPNLISVQGFKMLFSGPLLGFIGGLLVVLAAVPLPKAVFTGTHMLGQLTTPLALIFIGITIHQVGFAKLRHMPREVWLVLLFCFVIRPLVMWLCSMPLEMDRMMRQAFILSAGLPVSSVIAVMSRHYGADDEFASEAVGMSTVGLIVAMPILLVFISLI